MFRLTNLTIWGEICLNNMCVSNTILHKYFQDLHKYFQDLQMFFVIAQIFPGFANVFP